MRRWRTSPNRSLAEARKVCSWAAAFTLVETTLGTPWELDTSSAILVLEDRGMKPYQVDRALMHLKQAGKFRSVAGIVLGDFPECEAPAGSETEQEVASRLLAPLNIPIVWGVRKGHTKRPMDTLPLGVRAAFGWRRSPFGNFRARMLVMTPINRASFRNQFL